MANLYDQLKDAYETLESPDRVTFTQLRSAQAYSLFYKRPEVKINKAGYTVTEVACGWAGAVFEVTTPFGHDQ